MNTNRLPHLKDAMTNLFIDTSSKQNFFLLSKEGMLVDSYLFENHFSQKVCVMETLLSFLKKNRTTLQDLSQIHIGVGPGSYTGTRGGIAIGESLAYALEIPLHRFPSPLAKIPSHNGPFVMTQDAKGEELFCIAGEVQEGNITTVSVKGRVAKESVQTQFSNHAIYSFDDMPYNFPVLINSYFDPLTEKREILYLR